MTFTIVPTAVDPEYGEAILSLADAKAHLRVEPDEGDDDILIAQLRDAAIDFVEQYTSVRLGPVAGEAKVGGAFGRFTFGIGPAASFAVTGIRYRATQGSDLIDVPAGSWSVDTNGFISPLSAAWPRIMVEMIVAFEAGYPAGACPPALIAAAKLMLGHLYVNRQAVVAGASPAELPLGAKALCDRYRMPVL